MWTTVHRPKAWQDFVGNASAIHKCKQWLKDFQQGRPVPRVLVISGPEGCGKSLAAELLLHKAGYKTYVFSVNEIKNHKGDKNRLDNFCNLYLADLAKLGAAKSRQQAHGIIVEDFDSLSRNDRTFTGTILKMLKKKPSPTTPLIVTTDNSRNHKISSSLLRISCHVKLTRLLERDLVKIAMRVAEKENVYLNEDAAALFAEHSYGDTRQLLAHMEMFYIGRLDNKRVELEDVLNFIERNRSENDEKQCKSFEGDLTTRQSDEERILGAAIGDRGDNRRDNEKDASLRIASDCSLHFTPLLFQAYPGALPYRYDKQPKQPKQNLESVEKLAEIADTFSLADVVKELMWGDADHYALYSTFSIRTPVRLLRSSWQPGDPRNFTVSTKGYQRFYGVDNSIKNQRKVRKAIQAECLGLNHLDMMELGMMKMLLGHQIETLSDEELVDILFTESERYRIHPNVLETLCRLKGGVGDEYSLSRARKRKLVKLFEARIEKAPPVTVKFVDPTSVEPTAKSDPNDIFTLDW
jgi:DNA polymerase III delta prime subunit